jgi:hypothetical protein
MLFREGMSVKYKHFSGVIAFVSDHSISILIRKGKHRSQDTKIVVYQSDFRMIESLEKNNE